MSVRSGPPMEARDARVWPIGLACVIGLAVGFGAGYVVASRDRASVAPVVAADVRLPSEPTTTSRPPQAAVAPKPTVIPPAKADQVLYPFSGTVAVRSAPAGARVVVDGRDRGATPITVNDLARGDHIVRIMRDGYTAAERRIVLTPNRPLMQLSVPLAKTPGQPAKAVVAPKQIAVPTAKAEAKTDDTGTVLIESRPTGATVYMDNRAVGRTPLALSDLKTGDHAVRLELNGHRSWSASIKVAGGQNRVGGSLEKID